jgi:hypothetical protein
MQEDGFTHPKLYTDYKTCIDENVLDAVIIATAWEAHIKVSIYATIITITKKRSFSHYNLYFLLNRI